MEYLNLLNRTFVELHNAIEGQFKKDWRKKYKNLSLPNRKKHGEALKFYGYGTPNHSNKSGLQTFMEGNKKISAYLKKNNIKKFTTKRLHEKIIDCEKRNIEAITFHKAPYNKIFFLYLSYENAEEFLEQHPFFKTKEGQIVKQEQLEHWNNSKKVKAAALYTMYIYHTDDEKISAYEIKIDYQSSSKKLPSKNVTLNKYRRDSENKETYTNTLEYSSTGTAFFRNSFLYVQLNRDDISNEQWHPFSMYFFIGQEDVGKMKTLNGTYAGISKVTDNILAGEVILLAGEFQPNAPLSIARHLFLNQEDTSINSDKYRHYYGRNLYSQRDSKGLLRTVVGEYEVFWLILRKSGLHRGKLVIDKSFRCKFYTGSDHYYRGQMYLANNLLFITFYTTEQTTLDPLEYQQSDIDHHILIDLHRQTQHGQHLYIAGVLGRDYDYFSIVGTEMVLLKKDKALDAKQFKSSELINLCKEPIHKTILQKLLNHKRETFLDSEKYPSHLTQTNRIDGKDLLLIIDMQKGFMNDNTQPIINNITKLINQFGTKDQLIAFTQFHNMKDSKYERYIEWSKMNNPTEIELIPELEPYSRTQKTFIKNTYTPFNRRFKQFLILNNVNQIYICGVDTDACVLKTAMDIFDSPLNIKPIVIEDACASHSGSTAHQAGIEILKKNIGKKQIINSEAIT